MWKSSESIGCARYDCGSIRPGNDDWDDMRWDNPDYDRDDEFDREDDMRDDDDRYDDDRDDDRDDWDDRRDDMDDDRDDRDDDRTKVKARRVVKRDDDDRARGWYLVCNYSPPGNIIGGTEFKDNVLPKGSSGGGNSDNDSDDSAGPVGSDDGRDSSAQDGSDDSIRVPDAGNNAGVANGVSMIALLGAVAVALGMM